MDTLSRHLDLRADQGRVLELWWRDDDLETATDTLTHCLDAVIPHGITPAFAAIPAGLEASAVAALDGTDAALLVHGWRHANHAPAGAKKCEYGPERPAADRLAEIARAWERVRTVAGARALACFVPPWNRIDDDLLPRLAETGVSALSAFASRRRAPPGASVARLDTHVDLIDWRGTGAAIPAAAFAQRICEQDGVDGPVGILSHHRVTRAGAWAAWQPVLSLLAAHAAVRWLTPQAALAKVGTRVGTSGGSQERRTD